VCAWWCHGVGASKQSIIWWTYGHGLSLSLSPLVNHAWCCRFAVAASCLNAYASVCRLMCAECRPCFLSLVWWYRRTNERKRNYKKLVVISFFCRGLYFGLR
jgi:hypothetical protein